jgi:hypothetical protein
MLFERESVVLALPWQHLVTSTNRSNCGGSKPAEGQTTWWAPFSASSIAAISWPWVEIQDGVVALADQLAVEANLFPCNEVGSALPPIERRLSLSSIVMSLPWADAVDQHLRTIKARSNYAPG